MTEIIRCSSLPTWEDCARREASKLFRHLIVDAGFQLRQLETHVGALVGGGVHKGAAISLQNKMDKGDPGNEEEAEDAGVAEFDERMSSEGAIFDGTSRNPSTAQKQVARMVRKYHRTLVPQISPVSVEQRMEAPLGAGFALVGHSDVVAQELARLRDLKTGVMQRANGSQYGSYALLCEAEGIDVRQIVEDYLPRVSLQKEQPDPVTTLIPFAEAKWRAYETLEDIQGSVAEFKERLSSGSRPPEGAFRANPMSMLCSEKFCPSWGTNFCKAHKGAVA